MKTAKLQNCKTAKLQNCKTANAGRLFTLALALGFLVASCLGESLWIDPNVQKVTGNWDFDTPATTPVLGTDYDTSGEGSWVINNNRLEFDSDPDTDVKFWFLNSEMINSTMEMDIHIENTYAPGDGNPTTGNAGFLFKAKDIGKGTDALDGFYVGIGKGKTAVPGEYHYESCWFDHGWHPLWNNKETGIPDTNISAIHVKATVIGSEVEIWVTDDQGTETATMKGDVGSPPYSGVAGFRAWNCSGYIDNITFTNSGAGLDFP